MALTDDLQTESTTHYIRITFAVDIKDQKFEHVELDACDEWKWFNINDMPTNIFPPHTKIFKTIASGKIYRQ